MSKLRGPRACNLCHHRKVRCDVFRKGTPCSNCSKTSAHCIIDSTQNRRPPQQPGKADFPGANVYTFKIAPTTSISQDEDRSSAIGSLRGPPSVAVYNDSAQSSQHERPGFPQLRPPLPDYITPLPQTIDQGVLDFLQEQGALTIPQKPLINELLRGFVCYVYPFLPVLDLDAFLQAVEGSGGKTVNLLLFQAVMMAGTTFADLSSLNKDGYQSHDTARETMFTRVKLLYELDMDTNPMTMIQVLLLMTYWYGKQNDAKGRFYWLRTAFSFATDIGLDTQNHSFNMPEQTRTARFIWSCCLTRNMLLSLTERRQPAFHRADSASSSLDQEDLDNPALSAALNKYYRAGSDLEAVSIGRLYARKVKLCLIIERILETQYELNGLRPIDSQATFMVLIPRKSGPNAEAVIRDQELREWYAHTSSLPEACLSQDHRCNGRVLGIHSATLEMLYLTALSAAHRPQLSYGQPTASAFDALQVFSCQTLRSAARRVSEIGRHLQEGNLIQYLPPVAVGAFISASIQHLQDSKSPNAETRQTGHLYLSQTLSAFACLSQKYNSADCAIKFIERVRSGKVPRHSYEWEERATNPHPPSRNYNAASLTTGRPRSPIRHGIRSMLAPETFRDVAAKSVATVASNVCQTPREILGEAYELDVLQPPDQTLDDFSEILLRTQFDMNAIDWTDTEWSHIETDPI